MNFAEQGNLQRYLMHQNIPSQQQQNLYQMGALQAQQGQGLMAPNYDGYEHRIMTPMGVEVSKFGRDGKRIDETKIVIKKESYMKEILADARNFIKEHRTVIYTVALVVLVDHFVFKGQFREKLKDLVGKFLKKAEDQLHIGTKTDGQ